MEPVLNYARQVLENTWWIPLMVGAGWLFGEFVVSFIITKLKGK